MIFYVILNKDGLYYSGHCGKFDKDISKAKFYKSEKTAIRHYWSRDNYDGLRVTTVKITPIEMSKDITDELFVKFDNYNYQNFKRMEEK